MTSWNSELKIKNYLQKSRNASGSDPLVAITHFGTWALNTRGDMHIFIKMRSFDLSMFSFLQMCSSRHISTLHLHTPHWCQPLFLCNLCLFLLFCLEPCQALGSNSPISPNPWVTGRKSVLVERPVLIMWERKWLTRCHGNVHTFQLLPNKWKVVFLIHRSQCQAHLAEILRAGTLRNS